MDFFELVWVETQSLDSRESKKDILYTGTLHMYLDERDNRTDDMQDLRPNGFTEETVISDFPVRDKLYTAIEAVVITLAISLLSVLWQTLKAARTNPATALKKE